ncbi:MAG: hypothetical protein A3J72_09370, partial [Nitrospirae bacterium RIFCSPHIGHO2_02_FULL_40_19]
RTSDVGRIRFGVIDDSVDKLNEIGIKKLHLYKKGTLLFPKSGASTFLNHRVLMATDGYVSSHLATLKAKDNILDDRFLLYFSSTVDSRSLMQDQNYPSLRLSDIQEIIILLPSFHEQKRLAKVLDEVFEKTAKAKENAEKNLQNSRELFESYLQSVFANPGDGWEEKKLGEIANIEYGFTNKAKGVGDYRYVRITDIDKNGNLEKENKVFINLSEETKKFLLKDGDLLMARTGATYAKVLLYQNFEKSVFASYLIRISFKMNIINKLYWYFSKSRIYWDQAHKLSSGSAQPQFNGGALKELIFYFPKYLHDQKSIIAKLDTLSAETKKLEAIYQQKLADLDELKKSVLQKAFNGDI